MSGRKWRCRRATRKSTAGASDLKNENEQVEARRLGDGTLLAHVMHGRPELCPAENGGAGELQGNRRLGRRRATGRPPPRRVVGDVQRARAERAGGTSRYLKPEYRRRRGALPPGARPGAGGPLGFFSNCNDRSRR